MRHFVVLFVLVWPVIVLGSGDFGQAQRLHQQHCLRCHQVELYQRPDSTIKTLQQLQSRVLFCSVESGANWFDEEVLVVSDYLNKKYYLLGLQ